MFITSHRGFREMPYLSSIAKEDTAEENPNSFIDDFTLTEWLAEGIDKQKSTPTNEYQEVGYHSKPFRHNGGLEEQVTGEIERLYLRGEYSKEDLEAYYEELAEKAIKNCAYEKLPNIYNRLQPLRKSTM